PGVEQAQGENDDEDQHLDQTEHLHGLEADGPREDENRLHVEHHEEQGVDVVADVTLGPAAADRIHAALVAQVLLGLGPGGPAPTAIGTGAVAVSSPPSGREYITMMMRR